jgi:eukaryotic-like serine/threonine-protein kinase
VRDLFLPPPGAHHDDAPMRRRPRTTRFLPLLCLAALAACAGVSPDPAAARAETLPQVALTPADLAARDAAADRAREAVVRRRYDEAEAAARSALALDPRCAPARAVLGMVLLQRGNLVDPPDLHLTRAGEVEVELARQLAPDDLFVGWMRAVFLAESGHLSAAAAAAEDALTRAENAPPAERAALLGIAGTYRYELGEERAALPHLQAYVALRADDAAAHYRLGWTLLRLAEVPQGPPPGSLLVAQRRAEAAVRAFERYGTMAPGDRETAVAVASARQRASALAEQRGDTAARDEHQRAFVDGLREASARFPDHAELPFVLGVDAVRRGAVDEARAAYREALQRDPRHPGSLMNLGALLAVAGERAEAQRTFAKLLAVDAESPVLTPRERRRIEGWVSAPPN